MEMEAADDMRVRIKAILYAAERSECDTVILSAFGCGAFQNPPTEIAALYRSVVSHMCKDFHVIAFAIFAPGYGPDNNFDMFEKEFKEV